MLFLYTTLMLLMSLVGYWDSPGEIHALLKSAAICGSAGVIALLISRISHFDRWKVVNYVRQLQAQAGN